MYQFICPAMSLSTALFHAVFPLFTCVWRELDCPVLSSAQTFDFHWVAFSRITAAGYEFRMNMIMNMIRLPVYDRSSALAGLSHSGVCKSANVDLSPNNLQQ